MINNSHDITLLNIKQLFNGEQKYRIPIYQRNYAWGEQQISQLVQDIIDYLKMNQNSKDEAAEFADYYIGTLVTSKHQEAKGILFDTIDGQQRLTTFSLLLMTLRHYYKEIDMSWFPDINLQFESRKNSTETLLRLFEFGNHIPDYLNRNDDLLNGYNQCAEQLKKKLKEEGVDIKDFAAYLFNKVKILRVQVPDDTDLNHYFEIMNNRGEQLEMHEIVKARCLSRLYQEKDDASKKRLAAFNQIWEACSNMEKYLQYGFTVEQRHAIFGRDNWNTLLPQNFSDVVEALAEVGMTDEKTISVSLTEAISGKKREVAKVKADENPERFNSVVNFPNFLLHVLRIYTQEDVPLDDKRLIKIFDTYLQKADRKFVEDFGYALLKAKFLFDKFIIKREYTSNDDKWSLKQLRHYDGNRVGYVNTFGNPDEHDNSENRSILMLLSMFHVSTPTSVYKHWLNAALNFCMTAGEYIGASTYERYLTALARSFVFDRILASGEPLDYYQITYKVTESASRSMSDIDLEKLRYGSIENNLLFNYLDYLLWKKYKDKEVLVSRFEFTPRSSVEHFYPQNPMDNYPKLDSTALDSFGNLCLISHSKNSRLSNQPPIAKKSYYEKQGPDSIKQWIMMEQYDARKWDEDCIKDHNEKMIAVLTEEVDSIYDEWLALQTRANSPEDKAMRWFQAAINDPKKKVLLARTLLCFGDYSTALGYGKRDYFDWSSAVKSPSFAKFKEHISERKPDSLEEILQWHIDHQALPEGVASILVTNGELLQLCELGRLIVTPDAVQYVLLIHKQNQSTYSRELYACLIEHFMLCSGIKCRFLTEGRRIGIGINFASGQFLFARASEEVNIFLEFWNDEGESVHYFCSTSLNGNHSAIKQLKELGWQKAPDGSYFKNDGILINLDINNYIANRDSLFIALKKLLKNDFGLKLNY